jgi:outer membrane lipoprotein-sorting protein
MTATKTTKLFLISVFTGLMFLSASPLFSAEIFTAAQYLDSVSEIYGQVQDYEADIEIYLGDKKGDADMRGVVFYKTPNRFRINFSKPAEQVINMDGKSLTVYLPEQRVTMSQKLKRRSDSAIAMMASSQGLNLLKKGYSVAYLSSPEPIPLDEGSKELVTKLRFVWRSTDEGFRQLEISFLANGLIRRIIGITTSYEKLQFDFKNVKINQKIPDARFLYDSPASVNIIDNFLFEPEG